MAVDECGSNSPQRDASGAQPLADQACDTPSAAARAVSAAAARCWPTELVPTRGAYAAKRPALRVSAHQSGSSITTESSIHWPVKPWPAETGAPRRNRTYNPLVGRHVISGMLGTAPLLVRGRVARFRSCTVPSDVVRSCPVCGDQDGDLIMHTDGCLSCRWRPAACRSASSCVT